MRNAAAILFVLSIASVASAEPTVAKVARPNAVVAPPPKLDPLATREETKRLGALAPADRGKIHAAARSVPGRLAQPTKPGEKPKSIEAHVRDAVTSGGFASTDVDGLVFLVLVQATRDAQEDVRLETEKTKAIGALKGCKTMACVSAVRPTEDFGQASLDAMRDGMKDKLDSLSEMGEMESLRLQMAMDRMSKMMSTLSNLLKKISDTASGITQNLK